MLYLNSKSIPELQGLTFAQRMQIIRIAAGRLSVPVKVFLNVVKLVILSILFILIARAEGWSVVGYLFILVVVYPLLTRPLTFFLCRNLFLAIRRQQFPQ